MSEDKQVEMYPVFDTLDRLMREGHVVLPNRSDTAIAQIVLVDNKSGETVAIGSSFRDLCVNIVLAGL